MKQELRTADIWHLGNNQIILKVKVQQSQLSSESLQQSPDKSKHTTIMLSKHKIHNLL